MIARSSCASTTRGSRPAAASQATCSSTVLGRSTPSSSGTGRSPPARPARPRRTERTGPPARARRPPGRTGRPWPHRRGGGRRRPTPDSNGPSGSGASRSETTKVASGRSSRAWASISSLASTPDERRRQDARSACTGPSRRCRSRGRGWRWPRHRRSSRPRPAGAVVVGDLAADHGEIGVGLEVPLLTHGVGTVPTRPRSDVPTAPARPSSVPAGLRTSAAGLGAATGPASPGRGRSVPGGRLPQLEHRPLVVLAHGVPARLVLGHRDHLTAEVAHPGHHGLEVVDPVVVVGAGRAGVVDEAERQRGVADVPVAVLAVLGRRRRLGRPSRTARRRRPQPGRRQAS